MDRQQRVRHVTLRGSTGRRLVATIPNTNEFRDAEDLSTYDAFGKLIDENATTVHAFTSILVGSDGNYEINEVIPASVAAGSYGFVGGVIDSAGGEEVRFAGCVYLSAGRGYYLTQEADLGQGAYTIFGWPIALKYGDIIYIGAIETDGTRGQIVRSYNTATLAAAVKVLDTSDEDDDHNFPVLVVRPDQSQLIAALTNHASTNPVDFYRSTSLDVSSLGAITFSHTGTTPTYSYPFINPADLDQLDHLTRYGVGTFDWRLIRSENLNGAPPTTTAYALFINHYIKVVMANNGVGLWIATAHNPIGVTQSPTATRTVFCTRLVLWYLDWATDEVRSGGVSEGTVTAFTQINGTSVNELAYTNDYSNSIWDKDRASIATSAVANRWGSTNVAIQKLVDNSTNNTHRISQVVTCTAGQSYEFSGYFRKGNSELSRVLLSGPIGSMASHPTDTTDPQLWVNLNDGTRFNASTNLDYWEITPVGAPADLWYRVGGIFTARDTVVGGRIYVSLVNDAGTTSYSGVSTGLYVDSLQYAETPHNDRLMSFMQNKASVKGPTTATPLVVYDPLGEKMIQLMAVQDVGDHVAFLFGEFDDHQGAVASDAERNVVIKYVEVTKSNWAVSTPITITSDAVDGSDDDVSSGTFTNLGGDILARWEVVFDQQNLNNTGLSRIIHAKAPSGGAFKKTVLASSLTESLMRPIMVPEVTFTGSALRHAAGRWIAWMQGDYNGYIQANGGFTTDIHLALLTGGD